MQSVLIVAWLSPSSVRRQIIHTWWVRVARDSNAHLMVLLWWMTGATLTVLRLYDNNPPPTDRPRRPQYPLPPFLLFNTQRTFLVGPQKKSAESDITITDPLKRHRLLSSYELHLMVSSYGVIIMSAFVSIYESDKLCLDFLSNKDKTFQI